MGNSFLLIIAGLLVFYLVISDKWKFVEDFASNIAGNYKENQTDKPAIKKSNFDNLDRLTDLDFSSNWLRSNVV